MQAKKQNSFNHEVFQKAYKRLKLSSTNRIIFQRLLGFLIRNDNPFPYSAVKMAEITGFSLRTIFNSLNELERCRLIKRIGEGKNRRFMPGNILRKIFTTVKNRIKNEQVKNSTTVQLVHQNLLNRATGAYNKTSSFLKRKEGEFSFSSDYQEYVGRIKSDISLGLLPKETKVIDYDEWLQTL